MSFITRSLRPARSAAIFNPVRAISTTVPRLATGYGDTNPEQTDGKGTPTPASTPDPNPKGQGKDAGEKTGVTDPEVGQGKGASGTELKQTKKIGEDPKEEEVGKAGPIGG